MRLSKPPCNIAEIAALADLHARAGQIAYHREPCPGGSPDGEGQPDGRLLMNRKDAIRYERDLQTICFATQDAADGRRAFKAKRTPIFRCL